MWTKLCLAGVTICIRLTVNYYILQAFSGLDEGIEKAGRRLGNTALDAVLTPQFLVQIGIFTAIPMIMGFILELGLLQV